MVTIRHLLTLCLFISLASTPLSYAGLFSEQELTQIRAFNSEQKTLFSRLMNAQEDTDWRTSVIAANAKSGPAWGLLERQGDAYQYFGCAPIGYEKGPVLNVQSDESGLTFMLAEQIGQRINKNNVIPKPVAKSEWLKHPKLSISELIYISKICTFNSGISYWNNIEKHNQKELAKIDKNSALLADSLRLFEFQPRIDSIEKIETLTSKNTTKPSNLVLYKVALSGNQRSGFCSRFPDTGFLIAKYKPAQQATQKSTLAGSVLIAEAHCITSNNWQYLGTQDNGFLIRQRRLQKDSAPKDQCRIITHDLSQEPTPCPVAATVKVNAR